MLATYVYFNKLGHIVVKDLSHMGLYWERLCKCLSMLISCPIMIFYKPSKIFIKLHIIIPHVTKNSYDHLSNVKVVVQGQRSWIFVSPMELLHVLAGFQI